MNTKILLFTIVLLVSLASVHAATLTCQQISDTSLSIPQFSSKTIEIKCVASGGTVSNIQITPNADPSSGLTITSSQTISSSISDQSSSTGKWTAAGNSPNTYTVSYSVSSSGTNTWTGASTTSVVVPSPAQLTVEYMLPPSIFTPTVDTLDVRITNIGGTTANNVKLKLTSATYAGSLTTYPTTITSGSTASFSWTNETGFNESGTYTTSVYIGSIFHDNATTTVNSQSSDVNQTQYAGWNMISLQKSPTNTSVASIFSSIADNLTIVWWYNTTDNNHWKMYDPTVPEEVNGDLDYLDETKGFWVRTTEEVALTVEGLDLSGGNIPLYTGWNQIGYPTTTSELINDSVVDIINDLEIVWMWNASDTAGNEWKMYDPTVPEEVNGELDYMVSGYGYWFKVTSNTSLNITS